MNGDLSELLLFFFFLVDDACYILQGCYPTAILSTTYDIDELPIIFDNVTVYFTGFVLRF